MWNPITIIAVVCAIVAILPFWLAWQKLSNLWLQAFMGDASVSMLELTSMTLRKVGAALVVKCRIQLSQAEIEVGVGELEVAYLQGVDLTRVTTAAIVAKNRDLKLSFKELVAADLEGQLMQSLDGPSG